MIESMRSSWRAAAPLLALALLAGCGGVEVRGVVRDADSLAPLPGAVVRIGDEQAVSDTNGVFELEAEGSDDPQVVTVDKAGYESKSLLMPIGGEVSHVYRDVEMQRRSP